MRKPNTIYVYLYRQVNFRVNSAYRPTRKWTEKLAHMISDVGLATQWVAVRLPAVPLSGNNLRQVVHTHVPLSPSGINWYRSQGDDAPWLGR